VRGNQFDRSSEGSTGQKVALGFSAIVAQRADFRGRAMLNDAVEMRDTLRYAAAAPPGPWAACETNHAPNSSQTMENAGICIGVSAFSPLS
jgi:hypothetical protein